MASSLAAPKDCAGHTDGWWWWYLWPWCWQYLYIFWRIVCPVEAGQASLDWYEARGTCRHRLTPPEVWSQARPHHPPPVGRGNILPFLPSPLQFSPLMFSLEFYLWTSRWPLTDSSPHCSVSLLKTFSME